MSYLLRLSENIEKDFNTIQAKDIKKILSKVKDLAENPYPQGVKKIKASDENLFRLRYRSYRILYVVDEQIKLIMIRKIGHRKSIYKSL